MITPAQYLRENVLQLSQAQLGKELGISQAMVSKLEKPGAKMAIHHRDKYKELAAARGLAIEDTDFDKIPSAKRQRAFERGRHA